MSIERFFIIANRDKDSKQELSRQICDFLKSKGKECQIAYTDEERQDLRGKLRGSTDCLLVLGGDGTVLEGARLAAGTGTPILGINIGNVGYLAEVEYMVVGTYQIMTLLQFEQLVNLPGIDQTVTTHQGLVVGNLRHHFLIIEAAQLNEAATANVVQP